MKLFRILPLVFGSAAAGILSWSPAHALDFNFRFNGSPTGTGSSTGTVSGTIYGLSNGTNVQASSVKVTSASGFSELPLTFTAFSQNSFNVAGGKITLASLIGSFSSVNYLSTLQINQNSQNKLVQFNLTSDDATKLSNSTTSINSSELAGVTYTSVPVPFDGNGASLSGGAILLALFLTMKKGKNIIASRTGIANPVTTTVS